MRASRVYIIGMAVFAILVVALQLQMPKRFVWNPTYATADIEPLGCYVFDSMMRQTMPRGYTVEHKSLAQLSREKEVRNVVVLGEEENLSDIDIKALHKLLRRGSRVLMTNSAKYYGTLADSSLAREFGFFVQVDNAFDISDVRSYIDTYHRQPFDTIFWHHGGGYPSGLFRVSRLVTGCYLVTDPDVPMDVLAHVETHESGTYAYERFFRANRAALDSIDMDTVYNDIEASEIPIDRPVAVSVREGKGELVYLCTPRLMTNYGVLDPVGGQLALRLMNRLSDRAVVRTASYATGEALERYNRAPTHYFLSHPPLRTALQVAIVGVLVFMAFHARRRQRVIPLLKPARNHSLEFVQLIGSLYFQHHDNADLLRKKFQLWAETLRHHLGIDVTEADADHDNARLIATRTGRNHTGVANLLRTLHQLGDTGWEVSDMRLMELVKEMNEIEQLLN